MAVKITYVSITILVIICNIVFETEQSNTEKSYGPFAIKSITLKNCEKVMKPLAGCELQIGTHKNEKGQHIIWANLKITKDIGPLMGKVRIFKWSENKYSKILTMNQANVCQYAFPLKALPFTFIVDNKCIAKPAFYSNNTVNVDYIGNTLLGKKFFYGKFKFIFEWFTKKYTVVCVESEADLIPQE